ncbi:tetratricopeptide repeat protein [Chloroflexota bacterium]
MNELFTQIDALLNKRELKKVEVLIAKQLRTDPDTQLRAHLLLYRAKARLFGQHPDDALEDIQTARALVPEITANPEFKELLADTYFARFELSPVGFTERSDADHALSIYQVIIDECPTYSNMGWVFYQKGRILLTANEPIAAIECLTEALLKPSQATALTALCYERLGFVHLSDQRDPVTALSFFDRAAVTYPPSEPESWLGQLHILRSRALRETGEYESALDAAEQALQIMENMGQEMRSGQQDAHLALAEILAHIPGREADAVSHLQQFMQLGKKPLGVDVTWSKVNELLGDMLFRTERYEPAIEAYYNSLAFNPYHPWQASLYYQIARCYYRLRAYEKTIASIQELAQAVSEESQQLTDYRVFHLLGNAYFALEDYIQAVTAYQKAVELAPLQANDLDKIRTYLRFAEELNTSHA